MSTRIVGSAGKDGVQGTELAEQGNTSPRRRQELDRVAGLLHNLLEWRNLVTEDALAEAMERRRYELRQAEQEAKDAQEAGEVFENYALPDMTADYAQLLRYIWMELEGKDMTGIATMQGFCVHERHSWFQIRGDVSILDDPKAIWIFDPWPRGVACALQTLEGVLPSPPLFVLPHSPFHLAYRGGPV